MSKLTDNEQQLLDRIFAYGWVDPHYPPFGMNGDDVKGVVQRFVKLGLARLKPEQHHPRHTIGVTVTDKGEALVSTERDIYEAKQEQEALLESIMEKVENKALWTKRNTNNSLVENFFEQTGNSSGTLQEMVDEIWEEYLQLWANEELK